MTAQNIERYQTTISGQGKNSEGLSYMLATSASCNFAQWSTQALLKFTIKKHLSKPV